MFEQSKICLKSPVPCKLDLSHSLIEWRIQDGGKNTASSDWWSCFVSPNKEMGGMLCLIFIVVFVCLRHSACHLCWHWHGDIQMREQKCLTQILCLPTCIHGTASIWVFFFGWNTDCLSRDKCIFQFNKLSVESCFPAVNLIPIQFPIVRAARNYWETCIHIT